MALINSFKKLIPRRLIHVSTARCSTSKCFESEDVEVPMPWGQVTVKKTGNLKGIPILGIHGWLDNAATFDGLTKYLNLDKYCVYALDFPGHGYSSRFPEGMSYKASDAIIVMRRLQSHFAFPKIYLLGHSLGAGMSAVYTAIYPDLVERLIMIDLISVGPTNVAKHSRRTFKAIEENIKIMDKIAASPLPEYTHEDACARAFMANQMSHGIDSITRPSVETLMTRGLKKTRVNEKGEQLYTWRTDFRCRIPTPFQIVYEQAEHYAEQVKCPHLFIKASDSPLYMSEEYAKGILNVYKRHNPNFVYAKINGGHHLHLNNPEKVSPVINKFLEKDFTGDNDEEAENLNFDLV